MFSFWLWIIKCEKLDSLQIGSLNIRYLKHKQNILLYFITEILKKTPVGQQYCIKKMLMAEGNSATAPKNIFCYSIL